MRSQALPEGEVVRQVSEVQLGQVSVAEAHGPALHGPHAHVEHQLHQVAEEEELHRADLSPDRQLALEVVTVQVQQRWGQGMALWSMYALRRTVQHSLQTHANGHHYHNILSQEPRAFTET